jgi:type 1 glutamine amidotransferase
MRRLGAGRVVFESLRGHKGNNESCSLFYFKILRMRRLGAGRVVFESLRGHTGNNESCSLFYFKILRMRRLGAGRVVFESLRGHIDNQALMRNRKCFFLFSKFLFATNLQALVYIFVNIILKYQ